MTLRPEVDKSLVEQIKIKYPKETGMLSPAKTVEWAINKVLEVKK
jgi:hypothetical protein